MMKKARILTAKGRKISSSRWLARHINDPFVISARQAGFRSRAAYKLKDIDNKYHILKSCKTGVLDLGCAPGGWLQVLTQSVKAPIIGIDLQETEPIEGAIVLVGDFTSSKMEEELTKMDYYPDLILSDMAPSSCGDKQTDHIRIALLANSALDFAIKHLKPTGNFVTKLLQGNKISNLISKARIHFKKVALYKPKASYSSSSEIFLIALEKSQYK